MKQTTLNEAFENLLDARDTLLGQDPDMKTFLYDFYVGLEELILKHCHEIDIIVDNQIEFLDSDNVPMALLSYEEPIRRAS